MSAERRPRRVIVRRIRAHEKEALARAIEDSTTLAQIESRWHEHRMGFRELLVAKVDRRIVGTVSVSILEGAENARFMHLSALDVGEGWRNQGIGAQIIRWVFDEARRRRCKRVYLEVRADNPARRLYHRLGFRRIGPAFINVWWQLHDDGSQHRVEELSYRMIRRV